MSNAPKSVRNDHRLAINDPNSGSNQSKHRKIHWLMDSKSTITTVRQTTQNLLVISFDKWRFWIQPGNSSRQCKRIGLHYSWEKWWQRIAMQQFISYEPSNDGYNTHGIRSLKQMIRSDSKYQILKFFMQAKLQMLFLVENIYARLEWMNLLHTVFLILILAKKKIRMTRGKKLMRPK